MLDDVVKDADACSALCCAALRAQQLAKEGHELFKEAHCIIPVLGQQHGDGRCDLVQQLNLFLDVILHIEPGSAKISKIL